MDNTEKQQNSAAEELQPEEMTAEEMQAREGEEAAQEAEAVEAGESREATPEERIGALEEEVKKEKKEYLFLMAEFDNFRKRTLREKSEIIKNAGENVLRGMLPIMDDFERGITASEKSDNVESAVEGMKLIYTKLKKYLESNGVKEMESTGATFDADLHEAIAQVPAMDESQKGKVIDTVEKGYMINDKVLRHAKVAVAQ